MTDRLAILAERRLSLVKEGRDLIDEAEKRPAEKRGFSAEEQQHIDRILGGTAPDGSRTLGDLERVDEEIRKLTLLEDQAQIADQRRDQAGIGGAKAGDNIETSDVVINAAFRRLAEGTAKYVDIGTPNDRRTGTMLG